MTDLFTIATFGAFVCGAVIALLVNALIIGLNNIGAFAGGHDRTLALASGTQCIVSDRMWNWMITTFGTARDREAIRAGIVARGAFDAAQRAVAELDASPSARLSTRARAQQQFVIAEARYATAEGASAAVIRVIIDRWATSEEGSRWLRDRHLV